MADDVAVEVSAPGALRFWDTVRSWFRGKAPAPETARAAPSGPIEVLTGPGIRPGGHEAMAALRALPRREEDEGRGRFGGMVPMPKVISFVEQDRVERLKSIIRGFEDGSGYEAAAGLADNMLRDDRIYTALQKRLGALIGSPIEIKPADASKKAQKIAELLGGDDDNPGVWHEMFPRSAVADLKLWGLFLGIAVGEILWNYDDPDHTTCTIRVWHPQFLTWNEVRQVLQLRTMTGVIDLPNPETNVHSDGKWIIYTPYGFRAPWRRALIRPLAMQYAARQWTYRDWSRFSEKHGMPTDFVKMPPNAPENRAIATQIANRGNEAAIFVPAAAKDEPAYEFEVIETTGESADVFDRYTTKIETNIAVLINGQNLTTEIQGGSYAAATVHEGVELRILLEDATSVMDVLTKQVLWHWVTRNWGDPKLTSRVRYIVEEPEDELRSAETLEHVGLFVSALQMAGFDVDIDTIAQLWGIPVVPEDEDDEDGAVRPNRAQLSQEDLASIVSVNEARAAAGLGALMTETGTPHPDGGLTVAEYRAKHANAAAAAPGAGVGEGGDGGGSGGDPRPSRQIVQPDEDDPDDDDPEKGLERLNGRLNRVVRIASKQSALRKGHKRMSAYADAVKASGKKRVAKAMAHDLKAINQLIEKAKTPAELRALLKDHFRGTDPKAMAKIIERASILANLGGRLSVLEEV